MLDGPWGPIELWEAFGPTYPCIPRERIGDVLDGGKWCDIRCPSRCSQCCGPAHAAVAAGHPPGVGPSPCWYTYGHIEQCHSQLPAKHAPGTQPRNLGVASLAA